MEWEDNQTPASCENELIPNAGHTLSDESFTVSRMDQMFNEVEKQEVNTDSSLSLIDLNIVNDDDAFFMENRNLLTTPARSLHLQPLIENEIAASPILNPAEVGSRVVDSPANPMASLKSQLPFTASTDAAINTKSITASTPFLPRTKLPLPGNYHSPHENVNEAAIANRTYSRDAPAHHNSPIALQPPLNETYNTNNRINTTFTRPDPINDATFNKTTADLSCLAPANQTFEIAVDRIPERGPPQSPNKPPSPRVVESVSAGEPGANLVPDKSPRDVEPVERVEKKKLNDFRKPLKALNNAAGSRLKPPVPSQGKLQSRLQAPKSLSFASKNMTSRNRNENIATPSKPVNQNNTKTKTQLQKPVSRRSLLPPPASKFRAAQAPAAKKPNLTRSSLPGNHSILKPTTFSKHTTAASKTNKTTTKSSLPGPGSRGNTAPSSSKLPSRPPKFQAKSRDSSASSVQSRSSASSVSVSKKERNKPRLNKNPSKTKVLLYADKSSPPKSSTRLTPCALAMAILLDYVVNKVDGLSAPKLKSDRKKLKVQLDGQAQNNAQLLSSLDALQTNLVQTRQSCDRDMSDALKRHQEDVRRLTENYQDDLKKLSEELRETNMKLAQQELQHESDKKALEEKHSAKINELTFKYEEEITLMSREWAQERDEIENVTLKLQEEMDINVQNRVQELIQPYIESYEENKSLRAVLDMKNDQQQELLTQLSQRGDTIKEARTLRDHVVTLQQRNEDLQSQIDKKNAEHREVQVEVNTLRRQLVEQQSTNCQLTQRVEELSYRLQTTTPSPTSPFNPIFTPSPTTKAPESYDFDELSTPVKKISTDCGDVTSRLNGCS